MTAQSYKVMICGGGTGGHIFPAISIANAIEETFPDTRFLFVGALGRMEMQRVPAAGYDIIGLPVEGFDRKRLWRNIGVVVKLLRSMRLARKLIKRFRPDVVVGVGGYASGPMLKTAQKKGIPTLIQEQNSYAGVTNKLLAKKANVICVAYEGMEKFFPKEKLILTGNPVRGNLNKCIVNKAQARESFGLDKDKRTILVVGGSLGAGTINKALTEKLGIIARNDRIQFIWQTGKYYFERVKQAITPYGNLPNLYVTDFINDMNAAYLSCDLVIARAGAGSISELCLLGKPVILVPSPNVAEDHQTKNALALTGRGAAVLVKDSEAVGCLVERALALVQDDGALGQLSARIKEFAFPDSARKIANEVVKLARQGRQA